MTSDISEGSRESRTAGQFATTHWSVVLAAGHGSTPDARRALEERVRKGPLAPKAAGRLVQTVTRAIHYAHGQAIPHRDLKPSNVLIDPFDQPRVTDFGLAKVLNGQSDLTLSGQPLGSPGYMAPEQAAGKPERVGPASDVYGLGTILYSWRPMGSGLGIWRIAGGLKELQPLPAQIGTSPGQHAFALSPNEHVVAIRTSIGWPPKSRVILRDLVTDARYCIWEPRNRSAVTTLAWSADGRWLALAPSVDPVRLYEFQSREPRTHAAVEVRTLDTEDTRALAFSPDDKLLPSNFALSIDILDWDRDSVDRLIVTLFARGDWNGPRGQPDHADADQGGITLLYHSVTPGQSRFWIGEQEQGDFTSLVLEDIPEVLPAQDYRLVFRGVGPSLTLQLFNLSTGELERTATTHDATLTDGFLGFMITGSPDGTGTVDVTVDNFIAVGLAD